MPQTTVSRHDLTKLDELFPPPPLELSSVALAATNFLARSFRAGTPIRQALDATTAQHGTAAWDTDIAQHFLLEQTVSIEDKLQTVIPNFSFGTHRVSRFIRLLLDEIDHLGVPIAESLALAAAAACQNGDGPRTVRHIMLYIPRAGKGNKGEHEHVVLRVADEFSRLGHRVWTAGLHLCSQLATSDSCIAKAVAQGPTLELGSGTGICGRALVAMSPKVIMTDLPNVIANLSYNLRLNGVGEAECFGLDMGDVDEVVRHARQRGVRVVVAADVTYDMELIEVVVKVFEALVRELNIVGFVLAPRRSEETEKQLDERVGVCGMEIEDVSMGYDKAVESMDYMVGCDWNGVRTIRVQRGHENSGQK